MSNKSRDKGILGERQVAIMFRRWFPDCCRSFGQSRQGHELPDLIGGVEKHFFVEVKRYKKLTDKQIRDHWDKAIKDQVKYEKLHGSAADVPVVMVWRVDRKKWFVDIDRHLAKDLDFRPVEGGGLIRIPWWVFSVALDDIYPIRVEEI